MRFIAVALALACAAFAVPIGLNPVHRFNGRAVPGSYIVTLKPGVSREAHLASLASLADMKVISDSWEEDFFHGYSAILGEDALRALQMRQDVDSIVEDGIISTADTILQNDAPWGLARLSSNTNTSTTYTYDSSAGNGTDIYIVDTGVYAEHNDFGGRARFGASFVDNQNPDDENGHGTHVAATAAGKKYGVAKAANIISVKVLHQDGEGTTTSLVSGLQWIAKQKKETNRPIIVNISIQMEGALTVDIAVDNLVGMGVIVVVAAGNHNDDAANYSPARVRSAITVGATTRQDKKAVFSDFGEAVDLFAPGVGITSAWIKDPDATMVKNGTSMACPHVSGLVAYLIGRGGPTEPDKMAAKLKGMAAQGVIKDLPIGTPNYLARNDMFGGVTFMLNSGNTTTPNASLSLSDGPSQTSSSSSKSSTRPKTTSATPGSSTSSTRPATTRIESDVSFGPVNTKTTGPTITITIRPRAISPGPSVPGTHLGLSTPSPVGLG